MKRIISCLMVLVIIATLFIACDKTPAEKDYTLAIGVVVTEKLSSSKLTETVATIVTDADGKIVLCRLDCVDFAATYEDDGTLVTTAPVSKAAAGDAYGTMPAGTWAEQTSALADYVKGKSQAEVAAIALDGGKLTDADLVASCSINVADLIKAIDKAFNSEHKTTFKTSATELTAGLSIVGTVKDSSDDESKNAKYSSSFSGVALADGKVVAAIIDSADAEFKGIDDEGSAESLSFGGTKRELGEKYGVMPAGTWYAQVDAYAKAAIGKTADDIATLASEGVAGCTIYAGDYKAGIESAVKAAK